MDFTFIDLICNSIPHLLLLFNIPIDQACEVFPVFINSNVQDFLISQQIISPNCPIFKEFTEIFNSLQYLIRSANFVSEVQSIKAMALLEINNTYGSSNPLLCNILTAKLNLLSDIKINYIILDIVSLENDDLNHKFFGLKDYNLNQDLHAFYHKISNIEFQPYLLDREELKELHSLTHSNSSSNSSSSLEDVLTLTSDFASPSKKLRRL